MNRSLIVAPLSCIFALVAAQACSDDETPSSSSASSGATTNGSSTSSGSTSSGASNSSSSSSGSTPSDTCSAAGGSCVCGTTTLACPSPGAVRDGTKKCPQPPQGSGGCYTTCCVPGDGGALPPADAGDDADAGS